MSIPREYNLSSNPFPSEVGIVRDASVWADRREYKKKIVDLTERSLTSENSTIALTIGGYGQGKTHSLRHIQFLLQDREGAIAVFIPSIGQEFVELYRSFAQAVSRDTLIKYAKDFSGIVHITYIRQILSDYDNKSISKGDFPNYITNASLLRSEVRKTVRKLVGHYFPDFASVMIQLCDPYMEEVAWKWLAAQNVTSSDLRDLEVGTRISNENAVPAFKTLLDILKQIGYKTTYLLIDEGEELTSFRADESRMYTNSIRELIDLCPTGLVIFIACSAELSTDFLNKIHPALRERIPPANYLELMPLSKEDTEALIEDYLKQARVTTTSGSKENLLKPFKAETIEVIFKHCKGVIRHTLRSCYELINLAASEGRSTIDRDFCENYFKIQAINLRQQGER